MLAFSRDGTNVYSDAVAIIRAELPDRTRDMCYFEEITQGLGLANDSPVARPSLFNDSAEFAVMTVLDEQLLRMLYDPRLRPGMTEDHKPAQSSAASRQSQRDGRAELGNTVPAAGQRSKDMVFSF